MNRPAKAESCLNLYREHSVWGGIVLLKALWQDSRTPRGEALGGDRRARDIAAIDPKTISWVVAAADQPAVSCRSAEIPFRDQSSDHSTNIYRGRGKCTQGHVDRQW